MTHIDLTPLYRSTIGFDRMANLLDSALRGEQTSNGYPPYNIEVTGENEYGITLAVAGFEEEELNLQVENGVLTVRGKKANNEDDKNRRFLHQGIAYRSFERKFNLADHVEVRGAELKHGLLTIQLVKEVPEAMKPKTIAINGKASSTAIEHQENKDKTKAA
ncbi:Hsp20 family protein [Saccharospirillum alexandrii]|uniref:Hsp20 family protein n=1 Tax=Saccharospirillum alexandrii TaxID=2448477 RepID=UPI000FD9B0F2|nr:Hsp20 family protein [Saccharospirillum alexandrii]